MKTNIGSKFYKYDGDTYTIYRLIRRKNQSTYVLLEPEWTKIKVDVDDLHKNYIRLTPYGILTLSEVKLQNKTSDVVVTLHRRAEYDIGSDEPWVICRQNIYDFFTNQINHSDSVQYIGMSISKESCPPDID